MHKSTKDIFLQLEWHNQTEDTAEMGGLANLASFVNK